MSVNQAHGPRVGGFTLIELLVVIAIIGVIAGMMLPAVQSSRETVHRMSCANQLGRLVMALQQYELAHEMLPSGVSNDAGPIRNEPVGNHVGWIARVLPYLDEQNVAAQLDFAAGAYAPANEAMRRLTIGVLLCPSSTSDVAGVSNYAACHHDSEAPIDADNNGVLFLNSQVTYEDIRDGLSHTIFVGEKRGDVAPADLGWLSGTRATLRNTSAPFEVEPAVKADAVAAPADPLLRVGGFGSYHLAGVVQFALGDGAVRSLTPDVDPLLLKRLGNRADGATIDAHEW